MTLRSPPGTELIIFNRAGTQSEGLVKSGFNDQSTTEISCLHGFEPGADDGNLHMPFDEALSAFVGEPLNGPWTLTIADVEKSYGGRWVFWDLEICAVAIETCGTIVTNTNQSGPGSLRFAIRCANKNDTVTFDPAAHSETLVLGNTINVSRDTTILGPSVATPIDENTLAQVFHKLEGTEVEMLNLEGLSGVGPSGGTVKNMGGLRLTNIIVRMPGMQPSLRRVDNSGTLVMNGCCIVQDR